MKKLFLFLLVSFSITACAQRLPDGWYHVDKSLSDSIVKPAIITIKDIVDVKLDSIFSEITGTTYAVIARVSKDKKVVLADATEKAIGRTIAYISDGKVVMNPMVHARIDGGRFQITGDDDAEIKEVYRRILKSYSPGEVDYEEPYSLYNDPLMDEPVTPGSDLTMRDVMRFDSLLNAWERNYRTDIKTMVSSNTASSKELEQYPHLLAMGKKVLPMLVPYLANRNNFFMLMLYDDLQDNEKLKSTYTRDGEQGRAQETVRLYVEDRLGEGERIFKSDKEKIEAMKALLDKYGGYAQEDFYSKEKRDSILVNTNYEILEAILGERWYSAGARE